MLAFAALAFLLPATAQTSKADDVTVDLFYNNLSGGSWIEVGDYGYCWQPDIAASDTSWRPYADGYWAYTDLGWTWVSYEDFGWATYHYGRWARLADYGWIWVPGRDADLEWGPAWVSWRTGGEYVGWAPLPPESIGIVYQGKPITGHLDVEFNIGPATYNFVDVRYIGEPVLRERIVAPTQNVIFISQTVNVTNITYKNKVVYDYGPDIAVINQHAARPIQRLKLERQENVDFAAAAKSGGLLKPQGDKLMVSAPMHIKKAKTEIAPPTVKIKVAKANFDRGWSVVGDEKAQSDLKEKIKAQDLKKVPPMTSSASVAPGAAPNETDLGKHKGKHGERASGAPTSTEPMNSSNASGATELNAPAGGSQDVLRDGGRRKAGRVVQPSTDDASITGPAASALQNQGALEGAGKHKGEKAERIGGSQGGATGVPANDGQVNSQREGKGNHPGKNKGEESPPPPPQ